MMALGALPAFSRLCCAGLRTVAAFTVLSISGYAQCGVERWSVKTGTDADASSVNLRIATPTTIANLVALTAPPTKPQNNRVLPVEITQFAVNATLAQFKIEDDSDYHVVISDTTGKTMIVEIPDPGCVGAGSPFATGILNARSKFEAHLKPTNSFKTANIPVQIRGIGFFDFLHGQTGVAPNGIELHPVLDIIFGPTSTSVNTAGGFPDIAPNAWIEIKGADLAPPSVGPNGITWRGAPEFAVGRMPTQLSGVSVIVNGRPAYVYYVSSNQINVLTPLDDTSGPVSIVVTVGALSSAPFVKTMRSSAPSFLLYGGTKYVAAIHVSGSLLGPTSMSVPGTPFTPAQPGETVVLYGAGFGLPDAILTEGSATQFGALPALPAIQIGGTAAVVRFAGVVSPGLYQFNVVVPATTANGDNSVTANYGGATSPVGAVIAIRQP
jgi:uncharacterized protein (TIGR03437 family)